MEPPEEDPTGAPAADDRDARMLLGLGAGPAFVRRGRSVTAALDTLLAVCQRQREEWLELVRIRLAQLLALAGTWDALRPLLPDEADLAMLRALHDERPALLRAPVEVTASRRALRAALAEVCEGLERFNRRWESYLRGVDLGPVNAARDAYNRYYVFEKECVVKSSVLARQGFRPLEPMTHGELADRLPLLRVPRRGSG